MGYDVGDSISDNPPEPMDVRQLIDTILECSLGYGEAPYESQWKQNNNPYFTECVNRIGLNPTLLLLTKSINSSTDTEWMVKGVTDEVLSKRYDVDIKLLQTEEAPPSSPEIRNILPDLLDISTDLKSFTIHTIHGSSPCTDPLPEGFKYPVITIDGKYLDLWIEYLQLDKIRKAHTLSNGFFQSQSSPDRWTKCESVEQIKKQANDRCVEITQSAPSDEIHMYPYHHFHRSDFEFGPYSEFILKDGSTVEQMFLEQQADGMTKTILCEMVEIDRLANKDSGVYPIELDTLHALLTGCWYGSTFKISMTTDEFNDAQSSDSAIHNLMNAANDVIHDDGKTTLVISFDEFRSNVKKKQDGEQKTPNIFKPGDSFEYKSTPEHTAHKEAVRTALDAGAKSEDMLLKAIRAAGKK